MVTLKELNAMLSRTIVFHWGEVSKEKYKTGFRNIYSFIVRAARVYTTICVSFAYGYNYGHGDDEVAISVNILSGFLVLL